MAEKSYLKDQVYLPVLDSSDLFTDEEFELYMQIVEAKNEIDRLEGQTDDEVKETRRKWLEVKKKKKKELDSLILKHRDEPRTVRLKNIVYYPKNAEYPFPAGVTWKNLKFPNKISEFSSELTRAMGLKHMDYTLDQIVIKWKSADILEQIVTKGFYIPLLNEDGTVTNRHYHFFTASAGQLRRDKIQFMSDEVWEKIKERIECGLSREVINAKGGCNVNKLMAYLALPGSATDEWDDFDIDRCIVIPEFKGQVTNRMMYIKPDYTYNVDTFTVEIDHTDGCGMMLPEISESNFMIRGPFFKGLLCVFDYLEFCKQKNIDPKIVDFWGIEHDLVKERIQIIFTESMFKMAKFFNNFDEYKAVFKACGAKFGKTNYEEEDIEDTTNCYQFI